MNSQMIIAKALNEMHKAKTLLGLGNAWSRAIDRLYDFDLTEVEIKQAIAIIKADYNALWSSRVNGHGNRKENR